MRENWKIQKKISDSIQHENKLIHEKMLCVVKNFEIIFISNSIYENARQNDEIYMKEIEQQANEEKQHEMIAMMITANNRESTFIDIS